MRNNTQAIPWGLVLLWCGACGALVVAEACSIAARRYLAPGISGVVTAPLILVMAGSFVALLAIPCVAMLAGSVHVLPEIRRSIERRDFAWATRLIGLARRAPVSPGRGAAWGFHIDNLESILLYYRGDYEDSVEGNRRVFAWAAEAGDVELARESGYYLLAALAAMHCHLDVLNVSGKVEGWFTMHAGEYDPRRLATVRYLAAQSVEAVGWFPIEVAVATSPSS
ncbi:MAG: hypothetical protein R2729_27505 [Bryobacteraceae bacterium]